MIYFVRNDEILKYSKIQNVESIYQPINQPAITFFVYFSFSVDTID